MSVSHNSVIEIEDNITKQLCFQYASRGIVCPPTLKMGLFTVAAIDNIDHDSSSSTSQNSFHGISISVFQYPEKDDIMPKFEMDSTLAENDVSMKLPESYTSIQPTKDAKPEPSDRKEIKNHYFTNQQDGVCEWITNLKQLDLSSEVNGGGDRASFASFHAKSSTQKMPRTTSTLLPLLEESVNSAAMVIHCMKLLTSQDTSIPNK